MQQYDYYSEKDNRNEEIPEELQLYYENEGDKKSDFFSVSIFQITLCVLLTAVIFLMSFMGGFREKMCEATDYLQSFEIVKEDVKNEITAMKSFLLNNDS